MPVSAEVRAAPIDLPLNSSLALPVLPPSSEGGALPSHQAPDREDVQPAVPDDGHEDHGVPMFITVMPSGPAYDVVSQALGNKVDESYIDLADDEQVRDFCDDSAFGQIADLFKYHLLHADVLGGIFMHPGMVPSGELNVTKKKEAMRHASAILVRIVSIITLLISAGKDIFVLVSWPQDSMDSILDFRLINEQLRSVLKSSRYSVPPWQGGGCYEIVSSRPLAAASLEEAVRSFCHDIIQVDIDGEPLSEDVSEAAPSTPPLPDEVQAMADAMASTSGDLGTDDRLISPRVARPVCLQGEDTEAIRRRENREAIGGMRNPRIFACQS